MADYAGPRLVVPSLDSACILDIFMLVNSGKTNCCKWALQIPYFIAIY